MTEIHVKVKAGKHSSEYVLSALAVSPSASPGRQKSPKVVQVIVQKLQRRYKAYFYLFVQGKCDDQVHDCLKTLTKGHCEECMF